MAGDPEVTNVRKRGEEYRVEGRVNGRPVSYDVHASHVEGKREQDVKKFLERSLRTVADADPGR